MPTFNTTDNVDNPCYRYNGGKDVVVDSGYPDGIPFRLCAWFDWR